MLRRLVRLVRSWLARRRMRRRVERADVVPLRKPGAPIDEAEKHRIALRNRQRL